MIQMMRYTVTMPSMRPKYKSHYFSNLKSALKFAYMESKENERLTAIKPYGSNKRKAHVWRYDGSIENIKGKMLVRIYREDGVSIHILRADGTFGKRKVF